MKKLPLKSASFRYLEQSFGEWLDVLGYAPTTVKSFPVYVRELLHYMESKGKQQVSQIDIPIIKSHYRELSQRANQRQGGGLSNNYLNAHLNALERLLEYLRKQARMEIPALSIPHETPNPKEVIPLSIAQVKALYEAAGMEEDTRPVAALRDKAFLALFYDCGLRRSEGTALNIGDIDFDNRLVAVRKGKGSKARYVPFGKQTARQLENYCYEGRPRLLSPNSKEDAFLLGNRGTRICGNTLNRRLKELVELVNEHFPNPQSTNDQTPNDSFPNDQLLISITQPVHLHVLRHSIATHLLYQGMEIEKVSQFLGHDSLESTQVYTHIMERFYLSDRNNMKVDLSNEMT
ncbi:tyrosine recombinase XerC [Marivirga lumbricoides]|uniref:Tyrosine recombinase XerC n=1 Tax=Marivirga lumbricoides TaxID=1046115 RepID=A0ABQ1N7T3_9BACT|nr:tyrosine recombinase XerC [Marivirga lumbricoides]